jgi:hypothetical protein
MPPYVLVEYRLEETGRRIAFIRTE